MMQTHPTTPRPLPSGTPVAPGPDDTSARRPRRGAKHRNVMPHALSYAGILSTAAALVHDLAAAHAVLHALSARNQVLVLSQCGARGIPVGAVATFDDWAARGRPVRRNERAIALCTPGEGSPEALDFRRQFFLEAQTVADRPFAVRPPAAWDFARALASARIRRIAWPHGQQGWGLSFRSFVAVRPDCPAPDFVLLHEMAHVLLGHAAVAERRRGAAPCDTLEDRTAEAAAALTAALLGLPCARTRAQDLEAALAAPLDERSARLVFETTDRILVLGRYRPSGETHSPAGRARAARGKPGC